MKKILIWGGVAVVALLVVATILLALFLDAGIKKGIETFGPQLTKVSVQLDAVKLSVLSGRGHLKGLVVGNPEGYKTPFAIRVGDASLALQPGSLFSDKIVIRSVNVQAPEIAFEGGLGGNNLKQIQANVDAAVGGGQSAPATTSPPPPAGPGKKLQVDDFVISGGKVHVTLTGVAGKTTTVPLPDIHLSQLGTGPEGITAADLTRKVLDAVLAKAVEAAGPALTDLGKSAAENAKKSVSDLLKRNK
jgi:uncharacterized protein involved in outer membrane biogenesis